MNKHGEEETGFVVGALAELGQHMYPVQRQEGGLCTGLELSGGCAVHSVAGRRVSTLLPNRAARGANNRKRSNNLGAGEAAGEEGRGREQCKGVSLSRLHPLAAVPFDPATVTRDGAAVWAIRGSGDLGQEEPEQGEGSPGALLQGWRSVPSPGLEVGPL